MKRLVSALAAPTLPLIFAFVLTARPARLYAESSTPATGQACSSIALGPCFQKAADDTCTTSGGKTGTCKSTSCVDEAGQKTTVLACVITASTTPTPGKYVEDTDAGTSTTEPADDGCSVARPLGSGVGAGGAALAGLALAASMFARRMRRR